MKRLILATGVLIALLALRAGQEADRSYAEDNPRLASLEIAIWPEFDKPSALVILRGEIASDVNLPVAILLRIPTSSEGPAAVASAASVDADLVNLKYERADAQDFITLRFTTQDHFFQVEFYDRLRTDTPQRSFTYTWPGDLKVDQLSVRLQEPAGASELSVQPNLGAAVASADGFLYRSANLGPFDIGKTLAIDVSYRKDDSRTSAEILGLTTATPAPADVSTQSDKGVPVWLLAVGVVAALVMGAGGATLWQYSRASASSARARSRGERRRQRAVEQREDAALFCPQCGNRLRSGNRFCSQCGAARRGSRPS